MDGFRKCLQLTLYRPRDVLSLLNEAFYRAIKKGRTQIVDDDIDITAREISETRLQDLKNEYAVVFPGLPELIDSFSNKEPELTVTMASHIIEETIASDQYRPAVQQQFQLMDSPRQALRALYGVGFLGLKDAKTGNFKFCHDGRSADKDISSDDERVLVHPCYWIALNMAKSTITSEEARDIYDEYDIEVSQSDKMSDALEDRKKKLGRLMAELNQIKIGDEGAASFEDWVLRAMKTLFAGGLRNCVLKPNGASVQRRDAVGTNQGSTAFWKRVLEDYEARQVIFEVKNYIEIGPMEFRQASTYLTPPYGRMCFIVTRDSDYLPRSGKELDWIREIYTTQDRKLIIKLTGSYLSSLLSKLRNPMKAEAPDDALSGLLDQYERNYLSLKSTRPRHKKS